MFYLDLSEVKSPREPKSEARPCKAYSNVQQKPQATYEELAARSNENSPREQKVVSR